jgi:DHA1 family multidrug resistance protein-like MFS transporter
VETTSGSWRRNLYLIAATEFVVIMAFSFVNPFLPLFIQRLGGFDPERTALWAGLALGGGGLAMFLSSPIWGIIADRWGRKPMVLRAMFGASIILAFMGLVSNVYVFIALRCSQGLLAGTVAAATALVAASTPRNRITFAMGLIMLAVFSGNSFGPFLGGFLADRVGYRATFFIASLMLLSGGLVVLVMVKETFRRPPQGSGASLASLWRLARSSEMLPLLLAICALNIGPQMISPMIPLFIRQLDPSIAAATASGVAFSLMGVVAGTSSVVATRVGKRISLKMLMVFSCLGTGLLYLPPMWARTVTELIIFVAMLGLLSGGLMMSANSLVSLSVSQSQQGIAYGLSTSAQALGGGIGPLLGGGLASVWGFKPIFGVVGGIFILVAVLISKLLVSRSSADAPKPIESATASPT